MMNKAINGIKYWGQLFLLPIYWLSFLVPRDKNIWLFGSTFGRRFADNPRYFYLYCAEHVESLRKKNHGKRIRPIWISHNREIVRLLNKQGYEAYYYLSWQGIQYCLKGGVYLYDNYSKDISFWLSGGAIKINMWHGLPLKKIQADNIFDKVRHPESLWDSFKVFPRRLSDEKPSHYVLTTSKFMRPIFASAFRTKRVLTSGYPRIDGFLREDIENVLTKTEQKAVNKIKKLLDANSKMIYYMPTFRESEVEFFDRIDLDKFKIFLEENHLVFCVKLHPKSKLRTRFEKMEGGNIVNIDADTDPYVFLSLSDALITDYSSIYFDYLFAEKPIIFFNYDLQTYLADSREMYFEYEDFTPGVKAKTQEELSKALLDVKNGVDNNQDQRKELLIKMYDKRDARACERLANAIMQL